MFFFYLWDFNFTYIRLLFIVLEIWNLHWSFSFTVQTAIYLFQILYCFHFSTDNYHLFLYYVHPFLLFLNRFIAAISVFAKYNTLSSFSVFLLTPPTLIIDVFLLLFMSHSFSDMGKHLGNVWILVSSFNEPDFCFGRCLINWSFGLILFKLIYTNLLGQVYSDSYSRAKVAPPLMPGFSEVSNKFPMYSSRSLHSS